jgi:hypothetical protein
MNRCNAEGCERAIKDGLLMCSMHWYMVPQALRSEVWEAWREGAGAGTPAHTMAINRAILAVSVKSGRSTFQEANTKLARLRQELSR